MRGTKKLPGIVLAVLLLFAASSATDFRVGEVEGLLDLSFSYGLQVRTEDRDDDIIGIANGGDARSVNFDDGNLNYDVGITSHTVKGAAELSARWRDLSAFARAIAFYDFETELGNRERPARAQHGLEPHRFLLDIGQSYRSSSRRGGLKLLFAIELLSRATQFQRNTFRSEPDQDVDRLIYGPAVMYGLEEVSKLKRSNYLEAEFPHLWGHMRKLIGGGTEYSEAAMRQLLNGAGRDAVIDDLVSVGLLERSTRRGSRTYRIPFLYRRGLECTQRFVP
jgi:hypothetical protein